MKPEIRRTAMLMLAILVAASLVNSVYIPLAGRRARFEHLAGPTVFAAFAVAQLVRRKTVVRLDAYSALAAAWVIANGISSWLHAPNAGESLVHVIRIGFLAAIFLVVANLPPLSGDSWRSRIRLWLALGLLELAYGLLIWFVARYWDVWLPGASVEPLLAGISIKGTQFERNLFGILAGTILTTAGYMLVAQRHLRQQILASTAFLVFASLLSGVAMVLALTRSAWLAVVLASPVAYLFYDRRAVTRADRPLLQAGVGLPIAIGVLFATLQILQAPAGAPVAQAPAAPSAAPATPATSAAVADRLSTLGHLGSDFTVNTRVQDARWAVDDWLASPLLGRGTGSFSQIHGMRLGTEAWISNLVLHTLVDTGLVGLIIQMSLFWLVGWRTWQAARVTRDPELAVGLKAMTLGFLTMAIAYQVTDGTWLAVFWIHLGLMVNGVYCARASAHATD